MPAASSPRRHDPAHPGSRHDTPAVTGTLLHDLVTHSHAEGITALGVEASSTTMTRLAHRRARPGLHDDTWQLPGGPVLPGQSLTDALHPATAAIGLAIDEITGYLGHHDHPGAQATTRVFRFAVTVTDPGAICRHAGTGHRWAEDPDCPPSDPAGIPGPVITPAAGEPAARRPAAGLGSPGIYPKRRPASSCSSAMPRSCTAPTSPAASSAPPATAPAWPPSTGPPRSPPSMTACPAPAARTGCSAWPPASPRGIPVSLRDTLTGIDDHGIAARDPGSPARLRTLTNTRTFKIISSSENTSASPPLTQVERNTESTARQYDLVGRARQLGWPREAIRVIDGDLGVSGSVTGQRDGFEGMVAEVALGQVGIILALEVSRLARDNAAWYRLLDLAGVCDTLVADADGVYHPALFNDRLVLGMKGMMAESELHVLRARLEGGIKNKAARGELRRGLPVGLVWGEGDGEIRFHPDEAVTGVIARGVRPVRGVRVGAGHLAVAARRRGCAGRCSRRVYLHGTARRDHLGRAHLPCRAHHADPPGLRWRLRLRPHPRRTLPRPGRRAAHSGAASCPATSGRSSSPITTPGSPTGTPTWPTRPASAPTSARRPASRAPARSGRAARCCRAWPPAGPAAASWPSSTAARPRRSRTTTARAPPTWSTAAAPGT